MKLKNIFLNNKRINNYRNLDLNFYLYKCAAKVDIASIKFIRSKTPYLDEEQSFAINNKYSNNVSFLNTKIF